MRKLTNLALKLTYFLPIFASADSEDTIAIACAGGMTVLSAIRQQNWSCNLKVNLEEVDALPFTLGRSLDFGIPAEETAISRKHAEVHKDDTAKVCLKALRKTWMKRGRARKLNVVTGGETVCVGRPHSCPLCACNPSIHQR